MSSGVPDATSLCLSDNRFLLQVSWQVPAQGTSGPGQAIQGRPQGLAVAAEVRHAGGGLVESDQGRAVLRELGIGGSAAGTGLNVPPGYPARVIAELRKLTEEPVFLSSDLREAIFYTPRRGRWIAHRGW